MIKILLDAGHGQGREHNRGGVCFNEGDNNYYYSLVLKQELDKYEGVKVDLVRKNITENPSLITRSNMGNGYDLFLSIHSNASNGTARGTEIWDSVECPNKKLAQALVEITAKLFNHPNRGVKYKEGQPNYNWYGVLRFNKAKSAMIVENGFHDNTLDCSYFKNNHKKLAEEQSKVIAQHYNLKKKGEIIMTIPQNIQNNQPSSWANESWKWAKKEGLLDGTRPKEPITREELSIILHRLYKSGKLK